MISVNTSAVNAISQLEFRSGGLKFVEIVSLDTIFSLFYLLPTFNDFTSYIFNFDINQLYVWNPKLVNEDCIHSFFGKKIVSFVSFATRNAYMIL